MVDDTIAVTLAWAKKKVACEKSIKKVKNDTSLLNRCVYERYRERSS